MPMIEEALKMIALPTDQAPKHEASTTIQMAVAKVLLGAPPAAVAADLGCNVVSLMHWVKTQRREARRTARLAAIQQASEMEEGATATPARAVLPVPLRPRLGANRMLPSDRAVQPEDCALVAAAYLAAEFDYIGRRTRPTAH